MSSASHDNSDVNFSDWNAWESDAKDSTEVVEAPLNIVTLICDSKRSKSKSINLNFVDDLS